MDNQENATAKILPFPDLSHRPGHTSFDPNSEADYLEAIRLVSDEIPGMTEEIAQKLAAELARRAKAAELQYI